MGFDVVGRFFAAKGYACVVQDVRGKFSSEGEFDPGVHEVTDGYDTAEWAAAQEWSNGRVGCWGESYYGWTCSPRRSAGTRRSPASRPATSPSTGEQAGCGKARFC